MELIVSSGSLTNSDEEIGKSEVQDWSFDYHVNELLQQTCEESESYEEVKRIVSLKLVHCTEKIKLEICSQAQLFSNYFQQ